METPVTTRRRAPFDEVSRSVPRLEGVQKVTGAIEYIHHLRLPGMLYGKIVRSTVAHANIVSIDTKEASDVPGVFMIVTGDDIMKIVPHPFYGPAFPRPAVSCDRQRSIMSANPLPSCSQSDPHTG